MSGGWDGGRLRPGEQLLQRKWEADALGWQASQLQASLERLSCETASLEQQRQAMEGRIQDELQLRNQAEAAAAHVAVLRGRVQAAGDILEGLRAQVRQAEQDAARQAALLRERRGGADGGSSGEAAAAAEAEALQHQQQRRVQELEQELVQVQEQLAVLAARQAEEERQAEEAEEELQGVETRQAGLPEAAELQARLEGNGEQLQGMESRLAEARAEEAAATE